MKKMRTCFLIVTLIVGNADFVPARALAEPAEFKPMAVSASQEAVTQTAEYEVGVDDILDINVIKPEAIASTVTVAPDGAITVPYIGNVQAKGLTLPKIQNEVQDRLTEYMEFPVVSVSLRQTRSKKFIIYGQVVRPGAYPVEETMTLLHAITVAGGFMSAGSTGKVKLLRPEADGDEVNIVESNITSILSGAHKNVTIFPGDTIIVSVDKFFVTGHVNRPGAYPVEEEMSLLQAISVAGGFMESNSVGKVKLLRPKAEGSQSEMIESDITAVLSGARQDVTVLPGDTIVVTVDKFFVYGEVNRPGMYPLDASTTALTAISMAGGFTKFGKASRVKVLRGGEKAGAYETVNVNINDVISGNSSADVLLKAGDTVVVSEGAF